ncbi:MAG: recombinase family protein [Novosphingobium sp.]|nr:recombinase family protein [Novosphingobium sp.]
MVKVYAYYRVSTDIQKEKETEKTQKTEVAEFAKELNLDIISHFEDLAFSGKKEIERIRFNEMMKNIDFVDGIIVYDRDRLSRDLESSISLMFTLRDKQKVIYEARTRKIYDFKESAEQLMSMITYWANQEERIKINSRLKSSISRFKSENGRWGRKRKEINWKKYDELFIVLKGNKSAIARIMKISPTTLWRRLKERKIEVKIIEK